VSQRRTGSGRGTELGARRDGHRHGVGVRGTTFSDSCRGADAILRHGMRLWVWRRRRDLEREDYLAGLDRAGWCGSVSLRVDERVEGIEGFLEAHRFPAGPGRSWLASDLGALVHLFAGVSGADAVRLRVEAMTNGCPLFHADRVALRLLCTYVGPGTQWLAPEDADRGQLGVPGRTPATSERAIVRAGAIIHTLPTAWVAITKGDAYPEEPGRGLVHRSPPTAGLRWLVCVDLADEN